MPYIYIYRERERVQVSTSNTFFSWAKASSPGRWWNSASWLGFPVSINPHCWVPINLWESPLFRWTSHLGLSESLGESLSSFSPVHLPWNGGATPTCQSAYEIELLVIYPSIIPHHQIHVCPIFGSNHLNVTGVPQPLWLNEVYPDTSWLTHGGCPRDSQVWVPKYATRRRWWENSLGLIGRSHP